MASSKVITNPQEGINRGVNIVADAVEATLGAKGLSVGIAKTTHQGEIYERTILVDGVSVARAINLKDEAENFSAQILIEAARKQVSAVGDGTSVTISLARAIIKQASPIIAAGEHPQTLRPGLEAGVEKLLTEIKKISKPVTKLDDLIRVATISAKDPILGKLIGETVHTIGENGIVTAEESKSTETTVDHKKGMQLDKGWRHEVFVTNPERMEASLDLPYLLITDKTLTSLVPLTNLLNEFAPKAKKLVIIAPDISGDALTNLAINKARNTLLPLCIQAPSFGKTQKDILQDIAILTGARFISEDLGDEFEKVTMKDLGQCESVTATQTESIIAGGLGKKKEIAERASAIKKRLEEGQSEFDTMRLKERLGKLAAGVAVIHVGGHTEIEMKERRERAIDGIKATQAAMKEGIVPGGEIIYLAAREVLDQSILAEKILYKALERPFRCLVENAGYDGGRELQKLFEDNRILGVQDKKYHFEIGLNVENGMNINMVTAGIIDPTAVPLNALSNALSVAIQLITCKTIIIPDDEKDTMSQLQQA